MKDFRHTGCQPFKIVDRTLELEKLAAEVTADTINKAMDYVETLPWWYQYFFLRNITRYTPELVNTPRVGEWCKKSDSLLVEILEYEGETSEKKT